MTTDRAAELAKAIIGPAGLLGYLVGRGSWWPSEAHLKEAKRAMGRVMADAYELCRPIWRLHPQLDPAKHKDPLRLARRPNSLSDTPDDLRSVLEQLISATGLLLPSMIAAFPTAEHELTASANAIVDGAGRAQQLIDEAAHPPA